MSNCDLAVHLHFALFDGTAGYLLKPPEMMIAADDRCSRSSNSEVSHEAGSEDAFWPPPRQSLLCVSMDVISLHNLPKRGERRPRYNGSHGACHKYHPELSGTSSPPDRMNLSSPNLTVSLHPIGGFCAVSKTLPVHISETESSTSTVASNGMNAAFGETIHCVAAEPHASFLHVTMADGGCDVAYTSCVLGRLRRGYRILQLRSVLGTRIELSYVLVRIQFGNHINVWPTPRQLRLAALRRRNALILKREGEGSNSVVDARPSAPTRLSTTSPRLREVLRSVNYGNEDLGEADMWI